MTDHDHLHDTVQRGQITFDEAIDHAKPRPDENRIAWADRLDGLLFAVGFSAVFWAAAWVGAGWLG